jgi:metal-responsive CopG/Arc/MetJ family transcriptional regulator
MDGIDIWFYLSYVIGMNKGITKMSYVKTAISIQEPLLREVDALAHQMAIPRSRLFVMAVEEFIQQRRNRQLLEQLNSAYTDAPNPAEQSHSTRMKSKYPRLMEDQW